MSTLRTLSKPKKLQGGGARPNLFEVRLDNCPLVKQSTPKALKKLNRKISVLCKAANLPASNIASIDVPLEVVL